jgi:hypothetical protein
MVDKTSITKPKRLSKGWRTHIRRLKQMARKSGVAYNGPTGASQSASVAKKKAQP